MRMIPVDTAISGPTSSLFRHHMHASSVEFCELFVSLTEESVMEFIIIDIQATV